MAARSLRGSLADIPSESEVSRPWGREPRPRCRLAAGGGRRETRVGGVGTGSEAAGAHGTRRFWSGGGEGVGAARRKRTDGARLQQREGGGRRGRRVPTVGSTAVLASGLQATRSCTCRARPSLIGTMPSVRVEPRPVNPFMLAASDDGTRTLKASVPMALVVEGSFPVVARLPSREHLQSQRAPSTPARLGGEGVAPLPVPSLDDHEAATRRSSPP